MKIDNLKQLEAVIKLCRKQGVTTIKADGIELTLSLYSKSIKEKYTPGIYSEPMPNLPIIPQIITDETLIEQISAIETDELTDEQKLFYSVRTEETADQ